MIHLGDITKMTAANTPPVDCVTFGSPCQDLSIAGKRAGLAGNRSGLFMDAVRVIKEMHTNTFWAFPKFAIWENVPGAFSSNKGEDFHAVLEELARIKDPEVSVPEPLRDKNGVIKWAKAGYIAGDGYSIAWRTFDAQFWGVPQRRRRIAVVVDFGGQRAGEILFEREGVSRNFEPSIPAWKGIARNPADGASGYDCVVGRKRTYGITSIASNSMKSNNPHSGFYEAETSRTLDMNGGNPNCNQGGIVVVEPNQPGAYTLKIRSEVEGGGKGALVQTEKSATLSTLQDQTLSCLINDQGGKIMAVESGEVSPTLRAESHAHEPVLCIGSDFYAFSQTGDVAETLTTRTRGGGSSSGPTVICRAGAHSKSEAYVDMAPTIKSCHDNAIVFDARGNGRGKVVPTITGDHNSRITDYTACLALPRLVRWIVRRLTPTECERLQGFQDGWTDIGEWVDQEGKKHKPADGPRYKALGNSIALPQWWWIACKRAPYLPDRPTMGSLFDGIGGFPLVWETRFGKGTTVWASEIEAFPIAVTKKHFPETERGDDA